MTAGHECVDLTFWLKKNWTAHTHTQLTLRAEPRRSSSSCGSVHHCTEPGIRTAQWAGRERFSRRNYFIYVSLGRRNNVLSWRYSSVDHLESGHGLLPVFTSGITAKIPKSFTIKHTCWTLSRKQGQTWPPVMNFWDLEISDVITIQSLWIKRELVGGVSRRKLVCTFNRPQNQEVN